MLRLGSWNVTRQAPTSSHGAGRTSTLLLPGSLTPLQQQQCGRKNGEQSWTQKKQLPLCLLPLPRLQQQLRRRAHRINCRGAAARFMREKLAADVASFVVELPEA